MMMHCQALSVCTISITADAGYACLLMVCALPAFAMQSLYERACEYMELETRVEVLNVRFQVSSAGDTTV